MDKEKKNLVFTTGTMMWVGIGLGVLYWVFQAVMDYAVLHEGDLAGQLFDPGPGKACARLLVGGVFVAFGVLAHLAAARHRRAEETLRESEDKYRNLVERANDGITIIQDGLVKYVNPRLAEMRGETVEQIIGTPFTDYVHPDELPQTAARYERRMAGEDVAPIYETVLRRKGGSKVYAELNAGVITYQGKHADLVIIRDISERRQAEEQALRQIALLDALNKVLRETLTCETGEDVAHVCLAVAEQLTGSRFGFIGELNQAGRFDTIALSDPGWDACKMPESDAIAMLKNMEVRGIWGRAVKDGQSVIVNDPASHPDRVGIPEGHPPLTSFLGVPLKRAGRTIGSIGLANKESGYELPDQQAVETLSVAFVEALNRKRTEVTLAQRAAQLALINDVGSQIAAVMELDSVLERTARLVQENFGYHHAALFTVDRERGELVMRARSGDFAHLFPLDHRLKLDQGMVGWVGSHGETLLANDVDAEPRYVNLYPGVVPTHSELSVPIRVGDEIVGVLDVQSPQVNAFDENDVMVMETLAYQIAVAIENARLYEAVQRELTERRRAEEKLKHYAAELERSNRDLEQFAYIVSHDLQEPLRMVSSYLQLLDRRYQDRLDADAREFIAYAVDGATRMQALINALLSYSRVGTRGKPLEPTDCAVILDRALANLKVTIEESDAAVTHDPLPTVMADGVQLTQVFQNLISNAIKFHGERRPEVHIGAQHGDGEWLFSVRDNGIGIDPQHYERIFVIFQRLHTREEYPGTGIGLAICKKIVERHGGRIWVESQPGAGSTFYFTITDR
jgi:PAS domain S-box-containing protein